MRWDVGDWDDVGRMRRTEREFGSVCRSVVVECTD